MSWVDCILDSARTKLLSDYQVVNFLLQSEREKEEWAGFHFEPKWQEYKSGTRRGCEFWIHGFLAMGPWRIDSSFFNKEVYKFCIQFKGVC